MKNGFAVAIAIVAMAAAFLGCTLSAPDNQPTFRGREQTRPLASAPTVQVAGQQQGAQGATASTHSCGQVATALGAPAGCYNDQDLVPSTGGVCVPTWDCACCFVHGPTQQATAPTPTTEGVEESASPEFPELGDWQNQPVPRQTGSITRRAALNITLGAVGLLIFALYAIEREITSWGWLPLAGLFYNLGFGFAMAHIWGSLIPVSVITPTGVTLTKWLIGLAATFAVGAYLAMSKQVKHMRQDLLGYGLMILCGSALHFLLGLTPLIIIL